MSTDAEALSPGASVAEILEFHAASLRNDPLYLERCQVDTPDTLVALAWDQVRVRRVRVDRVLDFGAGDARFARFGHFESYIGYEVDGSRSASVALSARIKLITRCAFSHAESDADLCIGNPPYVRNQDMPAGWREMAAAEIHSRTGVALSGLANAWQYFLMLALNSVKSDGLVVQILPYEWVSRPAAAELRRWIQEHGWAVDVYRLPDGVFRKVLTAASITVVDKSVTRSRWQFHEIGTDGEVRSLPSPTSVESGVVKYGQTPLSGPRAKRGLSPGTQHVLTLTEGERVHAGLRIDHDVVRCVTSLRHLPSDVTALSLKAFNSHYRDGGQKCWLVRTDQEPSESLHAYLDSVEPSAYNTATCLNRTIWWKFRMPMEVPAVLTAQAFKGSAPKVVENSVGAVNVGGVAGIYDVPTQVVERLVLRLRGSDLHERLVPYANQMHKLEINQLNTLLLEILGDGESAG